MKAAIGRLLTLCVLVVAATTAAADTAALERLGLAAAKAYQDQRFAEAEKLYRRYYKDASVHSEARLIDAGIGLVKSLFAQYQFAAAGEVLNSLPGEYAKLRKLVPRLPAKLHADSRTEMSYWRGRLLLVEGKPERARAEFKRAMAGSNPVRVVSAQTYIGRCLLSQRKWKDAEAHFQKMMQSSNVQARNEGRLGYGEALLRQKQFAKLDPFLKDWWNDTRNTPGGWRDDVAMLRVLTLIEKDKAEDALSLFEKEFRGKYRHLAKPWHFLAVNNLGKLLAKAGDFGRARRLYGSILPELMIDRQRQETILTMGEHAFAAGRTALALNEESDAIKWFALADDDFSRFLASYKNSDLTPGVLRRRGQLRRARGEMLEKRAGTDKNNAEKLLQKAGLQYAAAVTDFEAAIAHPKANIITRYDALMEMGNHFTDQGSKGTGDLKQLTQAEQLYAKAAKLAVGKERQAKALMMRADLFDGSIVKKHSDAAHQYKVIATQYADTSFALRARFRQGNATFKALKYKDAAVVFGQYLDDARADDPLRPEALYYKGVSHRMASETDASIKTMRQLQKEYPTVKGSLVPRALLQAAEAAIAADISTDAVRLLTDVIEKHPKSPEVAQALYRRIFCHLHFDNDVDEAQKDAAIFFSKSQGDYARKFPEYAADIRLWLGDCFASRKEYLSAEGYFLQVVREFPKAKVAPVALYEAAKCAYYLPDRKDEAIKHLNDLEKNYSKQMSDRTAAQADYLRGDILAGNLNYKEADVRFQRCAKRIKGGRLYLAALGRSGDMRFSLAGKAQKAESEKLYLEALSLYNQILDATGCPADIRQKALFRRARVQEELRNMDAAIADLGLIFNSYSVAVTKQEHWDWYYFVRSGLKLATYYENNDQLALAISIYERLAGANTSFAAEARRRAKKLRKGARVSPPAE